MADPDVTIEKLAELSAAATPGQGHLHTRCPGLCCWHIFKSEDGIYGPEPADEDDGEPILINSPEMSKKNAEFIAACVNFMCQQILGGAFFAIKYVVRKDNGCVELAHVAHRDGPEWAHELRNQLYPGSSSHQRTEVANG